MIGDIDDTTRARYERILKTRGENIIVGGPVIAFMRFDEAIGDFRRRRGGKAGLDRTRRARRARQMKRKKVALKAAKAAAAAKKT